MTAPSILVLDDDQSMCELIQSGLASKDIEVVWRTNPQEALELLRGRSFDCLITDLNLGDMSGLVVCQRSLEIQPEMPVIVITAFGDMNNAIEALRAGAYDFVNKPLDLAQLAHRANRAIEHGRLSAEIRELRNTRDTKAQIKGLIGKSACMKRVYNMISRVGDSDASVVVSGESGTGKELVAKALHDNSERADKTFTAINCAAVPAELLESELFGHVRGAFTDAKVSRKGLFEQSDGGTLFLDEIGEMPEAMQAKLLRVLQERKVRPVGGSSDIEFDVRIISATHRDLEDEIEAQRFREDLYYRLNVVEIHIPPLRSRGNDILLLAQHFVEHFAKQSEKNILGISTDAAKKLLAYDWPGNVRQLENMMERAVTLTRGNEIAVDDLPEKICQRPSQFPNRIDFDPEHMFSLEEIEKRYIQQVLKATAGNKTQSAKILGLDRKTLYRKLELYEKQSKRGEITS